MCISFLSKLIKSDKKQESLSIVVPTGNSSTTPSESKFLELTQYEKDKIKSVALSILGIPYVFGAEVPDLSVLVDTIKFIDCSETIQYIYYQTGYEIRDGSFNQYDDSDMFTDENKIGDLVFKKSPTTDRITHVGIYVGNNMIVEATGSFGKVITRSLDEFKVGSTKAIYAGIRRLLKDKVKRVKK